MGVHRYQADYPYSRPLITVEKKKGLSEAQLDDLKQRLQTRAKELMGNVMVHELAEVRHNSHHPRVWACVLSVGVAVGCRQWFAVCLACLVFLSPPPTALTDRTGSPGAEGGGCS